MKSFWYVLSLSQGSARIFHTTFQVQIFKFFCFFTGYVLMVGFVSFAVCYKHGPLVDERSVNLLAWTLRLLALVLIYCGVTVPQCSYAAMVLILSFRSLRYPLKAFSYVRWCVSFLPCKLDILSSGFIYCFGKFLARVVFRLMINYISSGVWERRKLENVLSNSISISCLH